MFDPNVKKKKKKKKKQTEEDAPTAEPAYKEPTTEAPEPAEEEAAEAPACDADFDPGAKKKKKKKKAPAPTEASVEEDEDANFGIFVTTRTKKKKRKTYAATAGDDKTAGSSHQDREESSSSSVRNNAAVTSYDDEEEVQKPVKEQPVWQSEDRTMTYDEMLDRIFGMLNPDISSKKAFKMKPPVVVREGTKRVVLINFQEIVVSMNRTPDHLLSFMLAELGTSGSTDPQGRVTFKYAGRQAQKHMESVIKQYVKEYVLCKLCKSSDTKLNKDSATRLYFMTCGACSASRSVNPIKSGFQAQIGKRKKK